MMLTDPEIARCAAAVEPLAAAWDVHARDDAWQRFRWAESRAGAPRAKRPTLHLEDVSRIPFVSGVPGVQEYQHRARVRCGTGDVFASVTPPAAGYEAYCRDFLGLGAPELLRAAEQSDPCAVTRGITSGPAFERLVAIASDARGLTVHPYMGIEDTWGLAQRLAEAAKVDVDVIGPTPAALWIANDKAMFAEVVAATAGPEYLVDTHVGHGAEEVARALQAWAQRYPRVGIKRTRCASAMGNKVFDSHAVRQMTAEQTLEVVEAFLRDTEWDGDEEVLVVEWIVTDLSPSTQLWIPRSGPPVCQGVYEQLLEGEEKCFLGSRPSTLPAAVNAALEQAALRTAVGLQALGYVGRCSFDFVVRGDPSAEFEVKFIECNGRWGGTSTPMHLVDRLVASAPSLAVGTATGGTATGSPPRPAYVAQDWMEARLVGAPFSEIRRALEPELFDPRTGRGRFVLYNVGPLATRGKFDVIGFGTDPDDAWNSVRSLLPELLSRV